MLSGYIAVGAIVLLVAFLVFVLWAANSRVAGNGTGSTTGTTRASGSGARWVSSNRSINPRWSTSSRNGRLRGPGAAPRNPAIRRSRATFSREGSVPRVDVAQQGHRGDLDAIDGVDLAGRRTRQIEGEPGGRDDPPFVHGVLPAPERPGRHLDRLDIDRCPVLGIRSVCLEFGPRALWRLPAASEGLPTRRSDRSHTRRGSSSAAVNSHRRSTDGASCSVIRYTLTLPGRQPAAISEPRRESGHDPEPSGWRGEGVGSSWADMMVDRSPGHKAPA